LFVLDLTGKWEPVLMGPPGIAVLKSMPERISVMGKKSLSITAQSFGRRANVRVRSVRHVT
jgi:hypothetical protein